MRKYAAILLAAIFVFSIQHCKRETPMSLKVQTVVGFATLTSSAGESKLQPGTVLARGDKIVTSKGAIIDLALGTKGIFRIHQNTTVLVSSIIDSAGSDARFDLKNGKVYATMAKLTKGTLSVKTHTLIASVRGTSFMVSSMAGTSRLDVIKGKVQVNPVLGDRIIETAAKTVGEKQSVRIDEKSAQEIADGKKEIEVTPIEPDVFKEIQNEVKGMWDEFTESGETDLHKEVENEMKETMEDYFGKSPGDKESGKDEESGDPVSDYLKE